ncbi:uncharacterized protein VTP21DRAFT_4386 [Calcarisporiella thermophila]|uniref:uncharacterized protein n=1 Tax=Calcarisporiella thermophila TaxID=911321 RepID=UPI0037444394
MRVLVSTRLPCWRPGCSPHAPVAPAEPVINTDQPIDAREVLGPAAQGRGESEWHDQLSLPNQTPPEFCSPPHLSRRRVLGSARAMARPIRLRSVPCRPANGGSKEAACHVIPHRPRGERGSRIPAARVGSTSSLQGKPDPPPPQAGGRQADLQASAGHRPLLSWQTLFPTTALPNLLDHSGFDPEHSSLWSARTPRHLKSLPCFVLTSILKPHTIVNRNKDAWKPEPGFASLRNPPPPLRLNRSIKP